MASFAEIVIPQKVGSNETLTYQLPEKSEIQIGNIVTIPLRNRQVRGVILEIHTKKPSYPTKSICSKVENAPHLAPYQIELLKFISDYYFCPLYKAIKLFLPPGIINKKKINLPEKQYFKDEIEKPFKLTDEQQAALENVAKSDKQTILLHGITGSGKTEIYRRLTEKILHKGQQTLILVPEISLTPQTVHNFECKFGKNIAIIHSRLTPKQKADQWLHIYQNHTPIIIGSRSAIFAPFQNLGLIIIDEEHEDSYKQEQAPRYNTVTVAQKICSLLDIKLILGTATPSVESYFKASQGEYELIEIRNRVNHQTASLPDIEIVDLREEIKKKNFSIFSDRLHFSIKENLGKLEQTILFMNRRGAASAILCRDCGHLEKCPHCNIAFTFHNKIHVENSILPAQRMICHHCGLIKRLPETCPNCDSLKIKYIGIGTQKIEDQTRQDFPNATILRADRDTTKGREQFNQIYQQFKNKQADILIGTQMIGKGLHLPAVTLVGVVIADTTLTIPDYRSSEKTFQLLTQVAGRAGREKPGRVIIQTYLPDHYVITATLNNDYLGFFNRELKIRQELRLPPFSRLIKLTISDKDQEKVYFRAQSLQQKLQAEAGEELQINSYPALIPRLKQQYRWQILISGSTPHSFLKNFVCQNKLEDDIRIDVDPISTV